MKFSSLSILFSLQCAAAFCPSSLSNTNRQSKMLWMGKLDDLTSELYAEDGDPIPEDESREATKMKKEDVDRYSVGDWSDYVEFDEFDGGDGQMGVAGDGNKKLEKFDMTAMAKSKTMSAKNAWGKSTGYAESLIDKGVDTQRAQQLENWQNQQEVKASRKAQQAATEQYDQVKTEDESWRELAKFGVDRNQEFDLDATFGAIQVGDIDGVIELTARVFGQAAVHEFGMRNEYMGFADFRAAFTPESSADFIVEPSEGSLMQREDTRFLVKFKPQKTGVVEGYLVIETEDFKKTFKVVGSTA